MIPTNLLTSAALLAGLAIAAPTTQQHQKNTAVKTYQGPVGNGSFYLTTLAYAGDLSLSGMFVYLFPTDHWGDGRLTAQFTSPALPFTFNTTNGGIEFASSRESLIFGAGTPDDYFLGYWYGVPNYSSVGYTSSPGSNWTDVGLEFNVKNNQVRRESYKGKVLSVCPWTPIPCTVPGGEGCLDITLEYGLMWREEGVKRNETCADVHLKAVFPEGIFSQ